MGQSNNSETIGICLEKLGLIIFFIGIVFLAYGSYLNYKSECIKKLEEKRRSVG